MKRLLSITLALLLAVCLSAGVASVLAATSENKVIVAKWSFTGFEEVNVTGQFNGDLAYVIQVTDSKVWSAICPDPVGENPNIQPDLTTWSFIVTVDGQEYTCERVSIYHGGNRGYVRFVLPADFSLESGSSHEATWRIAKKDGSVTYVPVDPDKDAEALSGEAVDAIMNEKTLLNDKIDEYSLDQDSLDATYNTTSEDISKLFDGKYTEADGTKFGTHSSNVTITWHYTEPMKLTHYVLVTGNDTATSSGRNPVYIVLKGSQDGSAWTEIDNVAYAGIGAANHTPFGFEVDHPGSYTYYQITLETINECQLDELLTYGESAPVTPPVTEPEVTEPEVTEPEVTEPEVTEPEVTEPEVTEPEVTEPEVTEPEATEPTPGTTAAPGSTETPGTTAAPGTTSTPGTTTPDTTGSGNNNSSEKDDSPTGWIIAVVVIIVAAVAAAVVIVILKKKKK